jgi:8-oxo-dGTP pyrophosphatase MutT (NUDIX family)
MKLGFKFDSKTNEGKNVYFLDLSTIKTKTLIEDFNITKECKAFYMTGKKLEEKPSIDEDLFYKDIKSAIEGSSTIQDYVTHPDKHGFEEGKPIELYCYIPEDESKTPFNPIFAGIVSARIYQLEDWRNHYDWEWSEQGDLTKKDNNVIKNEQEFYNKLKIEKSFDYINNGHHNAIVKVKGCDKYLRGRCEAIIVKDNQVLLDMKNSGYKTNNSYAVPGGTWDGNENHYNSVMRECEEEVRIRVENPIFIDSYINLLDKPKNWVIESVPKDKWWYGYYTEVYLCSYKGKYNGHIDDFDKDDMIKTASFYDIDKVYNQLRDEHKKAIDYYKNNFNIFESSNLDKDNLEEDEFEDTLFTI